jgi:hypothetical protein
MIALELAPNVLFESVVECSCPRDCLRHGHCDDCREFHANAKRPRPPFCERKPKATLLSRLLGS